MIHHIAIKIVDILCQYGSPTKNRNIYIYGTECFLSELMGNILLFLIAILIHQKLAIFIWLISFLPIRIHLGGYHASSHWFCLIISTIIGISSIIFNHLWETLDYYLFIILLLCDIYIIFSRAIVNPKHPLSKEKLQHFNNPTLFVLNKIT